MAPPEFAVPGNPPRGFVVTLQDGNGLTIRYHHPYAGCICVFLFVWSLMWFSITGFFFLAGLTATAGSLNPITAVTGLFFAAGMLVVYLAIRVLFTKHTFLLESNSLTVITEFFGKVKRQSINRSEVQGVEVRMRINTSYVGSAPSVRRSWTVSLETERPVKLLTTNGREQAEWLGQTVANWRDVSLTGDERRW